MPDPDFPIGEKLNIPHGLIENSKIPGMIL